MTGLETILISLGGVTTAVFGTFLATARYYQGKVEAMREYVSHSMSQVVSRDYCEKCRDASDKDNVRTDVAIEEVLRQIEALSRKYDRILKILVLNIDIPNDLKEQILP